MIYPNLLSIVETQSTVVIENAVFCQLVYIKENMFSRDVNQKYFVFHRKKIHYLQCKKKLPLYPWSNSLKWFKFWNTFAIHIPVL